MTVYDRDYWWSDNWDQLQSGRDYDFSRPFFEQFTELLRQAPLPNLTNSNCPGVEYGNHNTNCKNCYLAHASYATEDSAYVTGSVGAKDSLDLYKMHVGTQCYEDVLCDSCNRVFFSCDTDQSVHSDFLVACKNMQESLGCINMRNHSNCILNEQYTKEEYSKERAKYDFGSYQALSDFRKMFSDFILKYPRRYATILRSQNVTGDMVVNSKNCSNCFDSFGELEDCKYMIHAFDMKDSYDGYGAGEKSELLYEVLDVGVQGMLCKFGVFTHGSQNTAYTYCCHSSSNLFGCVGLRSKQYCILNKQYSKGEYERLVPRIIEHMKEMPYLDSRGRKYEYGEFFPVELSPFAYNETIAQEYIPLTEDSAKDHGYLWSRPEAKRHQVTVTSDKLPNHIKDTPDSILQEIIECAHKESCNEQCAGAFKIIPSELQFHRHFGLALPRLCPNCRHYERLAKRNPFKLYKRTCQCAGDTPSHAHGSASCDVEFQTTYAPDRLEIIYCEQCYQAEVV